MTKKALPAPFRARPAITVDAQAPADTTKGLRDPFAGLAASGPREVRVTITGGRAILRPSDLEAALDLDVARSSIGASYDHKRRAWTFALDTMLRHGAVDWASVRFAAELAGLRLVIEPTADLAINRYLRHITRQTRPIPRVTWLDDAPVEEREEHEAHRLSGGRLR